MDALNPTVRRSVLRGLGESHSGASPALIDHVSGLSPEDQASFAEGASEGASYLPLESVQRIAAMLPVEKRIARADQLADAMAKDDLATAARFVVGLPEVSDGDGRASAPIAQPIGIRRVDSAPGGGFRFSTVAVPW